MKEKKLQRIPAFRQVPHQWRCAAAHGERFCLLTEPFVVAVPRMTFRLFDDRVSMLKANDVTELCHGSAGTEKVPELVPAVNRRGIPDDVIVDVVFIYVGADQESVLSLQKTRGKFIAELVCIFRRDLSRTKRLAHLICDHIAFLLSTGYGFILPFGKKEFGVGSMRIASIRRNKSPPSVFSGFFA
jgi:hypothetical protein